MRGFNFVTAILTIAGITSAHTRLSHTEITRKASGVRQIPENLKFGVATSAYQIEGGWNAADKSPSIWDKFGHTPGRIRDNTTGNDACKSYEFYKRDVQMLKFLGVQFYRFSISWTRILPNGFANKISTDGKNYYNNVINKLLENGIEPAVTLYHWDLPQSLQDLGGWANPLVVEWFGDYARILFKLFGDRVKTWVTFNEPVQFAVFGYGTKRFAPDIMSAGIGDYIAIKNILLAHAKVWHIYDKEFREAQKGICGIILSTDFWEGATSSIEDVEYAELEMDFQVGLYSHPIFSEKGGFPPRVIKLVAEKSAQQGFPRSRLPELTKEEIEFVKGTSDFYGFNHYVTQYLTSSGYGPNRLPVPSFYDDAGATWAFNITNGERRAITITPDGIRKALNWVKKNCNNPPIMIGENGFETIFKNDAERGVTYFKLYLDAILDAIELDGVRVNTYTAWSLMDNAEWDSGFSVKFGLFETDHDSVNKTRTARLSALWYKHLLATRTLDISYMPEMEIHKF